MNKNLTAILICLALTACQDGGENMPKGSLWSKVSSLWGADNTSATAQASAAQNNTELSANPEPVAPSISYEVLPVTDTGIGYNEVFTLPNNGSHAIYYQSRAGVMNVLEQVFDADYIDGLGYVKVEHAYRFGEQYILVVSTGENGMSCPATTYAFTYDAKSESVTGKTDIDGCSETVQAFADGNKLTVKKEDKATVIYNGKV